jgi:CRISPR-associated protein Csm5
MFRAVLPGSSIKGAIRTALFSEAMEGRVWEQNVRDLLPTSSVKSNKSSVSAKRASQKLTQSLFSPEAGRGHWPNFDVLRALKTGDVLFASNRLCLIDVRWMNLGWQSSGWRSMSRKRTFRNWQEADGLVVEAVLPGAQAGFSMQIDAFLQSDPVVRRVLGAEFQSRATDWFGSFDALRKITNRHAKRRLTEEKAFFHKHGISAATKQCQQLLQDIQQEPEAVYLQIGWGNGWRGMTGDWMDEETEQRMRKLYRLGRNGSPFPKTRRLAVNGSGPSVPLGWVRLHSPECSEKLRELAAVQLRQERAREEEDRRRREREASEQAELRARRAAMSPLQREMEEVELRGGDNPAVALMQAVQQGKWPQPEQRRQVAERIRALWDQEGKWIPDFGGKNKQKVKQRDRCREVRKWLRDT